MKARKVIKISILVFSVIIFTWLVYSIAAPRIPLIGKKTGHKVYLALGFHGNLYHSYRIDTNDEAGFGKDIRIIRKIIEVLDEKNAKGIPVKGVWDFENLFSLGETLPKYAPDIIKNIQRRVVTNGDEVILMSYNNALSSALDEREFRESVNLAIHNREKSGVADLFKTWSPYIRPQEMMITPGNYRLYKDLGMKGVVLYYSAIPFDAFRVFERELTMEEAHNPLVYRNRDTGEELIVIPAYNHGDLAENISIRKWVRDLHRQQLRGNIRKDVLLFINADADDSYWYGYKLPSYLSWLPNTGGLSQLVDDVADLDYVQFTTIDEYVKSHEPAGEISFGQDAADGSFNGYVSWSEKAYSSDYWSEIAADRRTSEFVDAVYSNAHAAVPADIRSSMERSFSLRMRLLSTTNFGMATPFLARTRERVVEGIIDPLRRLGTGVWDKTEKSAKNSILTGRPPLRIMKDREFIDSVLIIKPKNFPPDQGVIITLPRPLPGPGRYFLADSNEKETIIFALPSRSHETGADKARFYVPQGTIGSNGTYNLYRRIGASSNRKYSTEASTKKLANGSIEVRFDDRGHVDGVYSNGVRQLLSESLQPAIHYDNKIFGPGMLRTTVELDGQNGVAAVRLTGEITLPGKDSTAGRMDYLLYLIDGVPGLFIDAFITYPDTPRTTVFKPQVPALARLYDSKWQEVAPCELRFAPTADRESPFRVLKRNFLGVESSYTIDYFRHSRKNLDLANVNNHITAEYVAVTGKQNGIAVAMDTAVLSNFAFCPLKIDHGIWNGFQLRLNPFGTYFGEQYYQPTWSNGQGFTTALLSGDQYHTAACTFSGHTSRFSLMIAFFKGDVIPEKDKKALLAYARPPFTVGLHETPEIQAHRKTETPRGFLALYDGKGVYFHWEKPAGKPQGYNLYCGTRPGSLTMKFKQSGTESTLFKSEFSKGIPFEKGKTYYASIAAVDETGREGARSREIVFTAETVKSKDMDLPVSLQLKILFATLKSMID